MQLAPNGAANSLWQRPCCTDLGLSASPSARLRLSWRFVHMQTVSQILPAAQPAAHPCALSSQGYLRPRSAGAFHAARSQRPQKNISGREPGAPHRSEGAQGRHVGQNGNSSFAGVAVPLRQYPYRTLFPVLPHLAGADRLVAWRPCRCTEAIGTCRHHQDHPAPEAHLDWPSEPDYGPPRAHHGDGAATCMPSPALRRLLGGWTAMSKHTPLPWREKLTRLRVSASS